VPQQQFSRLSKVPQRLAYAISARAPVAEEKYETDKDDEGRDYIPPILSTHLRSIGTGKPSP
jgi:hypothetical protein